MVKLENHLGVIDVSYDYLEGIVKNAVASCYGIAGLAAPAKKKSLLSLMLRRDQQERGVSMRFAVEESTDFSVARVNVFIDGMKTH